MYYSVWSVFRTTIWYILIYVKGNVRVHEWVRRSVYVCLYICIHICVRACVWANMRVCLSMFTRVCVRVIASASAYPLSTFIHICHGTCAHVMSRGVLSWRHVTWHIWRRGRPPWERDPATNYYRLSWLVSVALAWSAITSLARLLFADTEPSVGPQRSVCVDVVRSTSSLAVSPEGSVARRARTNRPVRHWSCCTNQ